MFSSEHSTKEQSPPTWGASDAADPELGLRRAIPTYVERLVRERIGPRGFSSNPHVRGEVSPAIWMTCSLFEQSRRTWGVFVEGCEVHRERRAIPTYVGDGTAIGAGAGGLRAIPTYVRKCVRWLSGAEALRSVLRHAVRLAQRTPSRTARFGYSHLIGDVAFGCCQTRFVSVQSPHRWEVQW